jgi:predicted RNase H-like HicB family nuclease
MKNLTSKEKEKINYFRILFPRIINIRTHFCEDDNNYTISILEFPGAMTQAENLDDLITMVSDCVATILNVPKKYLSYMPRYLPSVELAQHMNAFPRIKIIRESKLSIKELSFQR